MQSKNITIVGGGIIGLCSAWYLQVAGYTITIIDEGDFTDGTSYGNAGMIVPSHFIPMAAPGLITQSLKWLLNSKSPFYIKPRFDLGLAQWIWNFLKSANEKKVNIAAPVLLQFNELSKQLYKEIQENDKLDFAYEEKGLLMLYKTEKHAAGEAAMAAIANNLGVMANVFNKEELKTLEPNVELDVLGGVYFPDDAHLNPNKLMVALQNALLKKGVNFITKTKVIDFKISGKKITELIFENGKPLIVENVLFTTGSWTAKLLRKCGIKMLLQDGKGYSMTFENLSLQPEVPTIFTEARVAITPMGNKLRVGGTLELSGLNNNINEKRVQGILESVPQYYTNVQLPTVENIWKGYRPCTPDGMPYIGKTKHLRNLTIATGHGMMGLSLGAATGKLITEIVVQEKTSIPIELFNVDRF